MSRPLPPASVVPAVRRIYRAVWKMTYEAGHGPLHYAGGSYWHDELLKQADRWERLAADARVVAQYLPDGEDFYDVPATRGGREDAA
jgi:hypothetical protein